MTCLRDQDSEYFTDDLKISKIYSSGFDKERNIIYHPDYSEECESVDSNTLNGEEIECQDVVYFDGNDADFDICEDEDTLIERIWWLMEPPKIPCQCCVVPARRIQVTKERLSSTIKGLPKLSEVLSREIKKNSKRRQRVKSNVEYIEIHSFDDKKPASCQTDRITIVPNCAQRLETFF